MKTMGQAVDEAIKTHEAKYPESKVYYAEIKKHEFKKDLWVITVDADHFSEYLHYYVEA